MHRAKNNTMVYRLIVENVREYWSDESNHREENNSAVDEENPISNYENLNNRICFLSRYSIDLTEKNEQMG